MNRGTIYLQEVPTADPKTVLEIKGGTVTGKIYPEPLSVPDTYTATVTLNRDGAVWADHGKTVKLKEDGGTAEYTNGASVPDGTYRIFVDGTDTNRTLTVSRAAQTAQIDYYTVTYYDGTAAYGNETAQKPQTVLKGGKAVKPASAPTKAGFSFAKWVTEAGGTAEYDFENTAVTQKTAVYASWTSTGQTGGQDNPGHSSSGDGNGSSSGTAAKAPSTTTSTTTGDGGSMTTTTTTSTDNSGKKTTVTTEVKKDAAGNVTGSTTTVTTDRIQTTAGEGNSLVTISPDAAAINSAAGAAGAAAGNPLEVLVKLPQETIAGELQKQEVSSVAVEVLIPKAVSDNPGVDVGVSIGKETIQAAKELGKELSVTVRNEDGTVEAVRSMNGQAMKELPDQAADVSVGLHSAPIQSDDPSAQAVKPLAEAAGSENGLVLNISGSGVLPETKLTVPATDQTGIKPGDSVTLYRFDQTANRLVPVPGGTYVVDANGNVTIDLPAKDFATGPDKYVLLPGAPVTAPTGGNTYQIKKGDTLNQIARENGCTVEELLSLNQVDVMDLQIGQVIQLPAR